MKLIKLVQPLLIVLTALAYLLFESWIFAIISTALFIIQYGIALNLLREIDNLVRLYRHALLIYLNVAMALALIILSGEGGAWWGVLFIPIALGFYALTLFVRLRPRGPGRRGRFLTNLEI